MTQPASWWTKVTLVDNNDSSNKYYVMLSGKDYTKYSNDPVYAAKLLQEAKTQAIATVLRQQEVANETAKSNNSTQDILSYQDVSCSSPQTTEERELYSDSTNFDGKWTFASTTLLVELVKQNCAGLRSPNVRKFMFWKKIQELMKENHYNYKWKQLQKKWCNLLGTYKRAKERQMIKLKNGRPCVTRWAYLDAFDAIYQNDPKILRILNQSKNNFSSKLITLDTKKDSSECSSDMNSSEFEQSMDAEVLTSNKNGGSKSLSEICRLLEEKSERESEVLVVLKKMCDVSAQQEARRTEAIENLTTCVMQLTDAIKILIEKQ